MTGYTGIATLAGKTPIRIPRNSPAQRYRYRDVLKGTDKRKCERPITRLRKRVDADKALAVKYSRS